MDEQVKARLIGATVLVVIAVALVPELLSGPKGASPASSDGTRGVRVHTIDLGGAVANSQRLEPTPAPAAPTREAPRLPTVAAPGSAATGTDDAEPGAAPTALAADLPGLPAATVASSEPIAPPPTRAAGTVNPQPQPTPTRSAVPAGGQGAWAVQVGAFGSADTARKLVADLKGDGLSAYVAPLARNGKTLHRVRVGPEPTKSDADKVAARLKARGLPASVVSND